jgi:hypothetical protein
VTDELAIRRVLDHLGLTTPQAEKPPLPVLEILRVAEHGAAGARRPSGSDPNLPYEAPVSDIFPLGNRSAAISRPRRSTAAGR